MSRKWGDGAIDYREHLAAEIDFSPGIEPWVLCKCGVKVFRDDHYSLHDAFARHLGRDVKVDVIRAQDQASDGEVEDFLRRIEDPDFQPPVTAAGSSLFVTERDMGSLYEALDILRRDHEPREPEECAVCLKLDELEASWAT